MLLRDRRLGFALLVSATFHLMVLAILLFRTRALNPPPVPITLEYPAPPGPAATETSKDHAKKRGESHGLPRFSQLLPKFSMQPNPLPDTTGDEDGPSWADTHAYDSVLLSDDDGLSTTQAEFVRSLWTVIDQSIEENPFLSEYNHTGKVFLRFEVNEKDQFESRSLLASAADRVLKVLAARAVRKAMKNETGDVHFPHQRMVINARFNWSSYQACESLRGFHGNFLSFCHYAENKRKTFSTGEKVSTYAAEILNHGPWAAEEIKKYHQQENRRKTQFDPFEELKRDPDWNL